MDPHVAVLGAGVSGLGLAWQLASRDVAVTVIEANTTVGGLARTVREDAYSLDVGTHSFFSDEQRIVRTVLELFDYVLDPAPRRAKFLYQGRYLDYPLTPKGVLLQMGLGSGLLVVLSYLKQKLLARRRPTLGTEEETVEDWAVTSFGERLYRHFFKPYTEQFWKVSCSELSSRSIPTHTRMTFMNTLRVMLLSGGPGKDASLVEREMLPTYYPATGFGEIPERIAEAVRAAGGRVRTGCRATEVSETSSGRMRVAYERGEIECTHVVSTIPLNRLCPILRPAPDPETLASAERLDYRGLIVLGMVTEKQDILGCGYIHVMNRPYNRICEMNEFSQTTSPEGENILCVELPCHADGPIWNAGPERLFDLCSESLAGDGFLLPGDVKRLILVKDPCAYPVYRKDYAGHLERVLDHIRQRRRLRTLGRCGEFMYMDTDKCLARAFAFADEMLAGFGKSAGER